MKSDPSLKVGIVGSTYPREDTDTAVPWLREIVGRTADSGHDVRVIAPSFKAWPPTSSMAFPFIAFATDRRSGKR